MPRDRRSFFEKFTGSINKDDYEEDIEVENLDRPQRSASKKDPVSKNNDDEWVSEEEGQLTLDVYQTPDELVLKSIVAGVKPDNLDVSITQDMITIRGRREHSEEVTKEDYYYQELYWGSFSRSVLLPQEVDVDGSEATIKNGVLTIRLPKIDRGRVQKLKITQG
ncbi:Hsp20/alpha crystallin family protein [Patescibacteria group bacterium]